MSSPSRYTSFSFISCNGWPGAWPHARKVGAKPFASAWAMALPWHVPKPVSTRQTRWGKITDQSGLERPEHCCQGQVGFAKSNAASNGLLVLYYLWSFGPPMCRSTASGAQKLLAAALGSDMITQLGKSFRAPWKFLTGQVIYDEHWLRWRILKDAEDEPLIAEWRRQITGIKLQLFSILMTPFSF